MSRTFQYNFDFNVTVVAPDDFVKQRLAESEDDDAPEFLKVAVQQYAVGTPDENTDGFIEHLIKHGIRRFVQVTVADLIKSSGMGGRVSPLTATCVSPALPTNSEG